MNEKYFTLSDVHVGDVTPCIVDEIRDGGIIVRVGMLNGFVPATHSADVPLHQPAKRYPPGTRVSGRVTDFQIRIMLYGGGKKVLIYYNFPLLCPGVEA